VRINLLTKGTQYGYSFYEFQVIGCNGAAPPRRPPGPAERHLYPDWSDDFNGTSLSTANWGYDNNAHNNGEAQQYTPTTSPSAAAS